MKPKRTSKLSTWVLWCCMMITLVVFDLFYYQYTMQEIVEPGLILNWLYLLLAVVSVVLLTFSLVRTIRQWKEKPKSIFGQAIWLIVLIAILGLSYGVSDSTPLLMPGYSGGENTAFWLKLTDMWIYSLYLLLGLNALALFLGILWSYIKRTR